MVQIKNYSIHDDVEILGQVFHGLEDIRHHVEMSMRDRADDHPGACKTSKKGTVHVGQLWMSYPCFDSSDYLCEDRTYQNYILRTRPITGHDLRLLVDLPSGINSQRLLPDVPEDMLPMVYYRGDGNTMLVGLSDKQSPSSLWTRLKKMVGIRNRDLV